MKCSLCQSDRKLCKSHIIPEFIYKPMYDAENRFRVIPGDPHNKIHFKQKGIYERLLCEPCECHLNRHENYVSKSLYQQGIYDYAKNGLINIKGLDYAQIRLFYLSILWRMSVSSRSEFADISLGTHEKVIQKMILDDDPCPPSQYGFLGIVPSINGKFYCDYIMAPDFIRTDGHRVYRAVIGGVLFLFFISSHSVPSEIQKTFIQPNGSWVLLCIDIDRIPFLINNLSELSKIHNIYKN